MAKLLKRLYNFAPGIRLTERTAPSTPPADTADFYLKSDGYLYFKNDAGLEVAVSPGRELGYVQATSIKSTTNTFGAEDVPGMGTGSVTIGARPVEIVLDGPFMNHSVANGRAGILIMEDNTTIIGGLTVACHPTATRFVPGPHRVIRRTPSAGTHDWKLQFWVVDAGTFNLQSGVVASVDYGPLSLSVIER